MRTGVVASALAHAALIAFGLLSLGAAEPLMPDAMDSISVDLVPVSDFSNIRVGTLNSEIVETDTPSAVKKPTPKTKSSTVFCARTFITIIIGSPGT